MTSHKLCPECQGSGLLVVEVEPEMVQSYAVYRPQYKPRNRDRYLKLVKVSGARAYRRTVRKEWK